jgi:hypothetical protein
VQISILHNAEGLLWVEFSYSALVGEWPLLALNVSADTARFRQLSEAFGKTYARCEPFSG